jgi:hypothetical protein
VLFDEQNSILEDMVSAARGSGILDVPRMESEQRLLVVRACELRSMP